MEGKTDKKEKITLSRPLRILIFALICSVELAINWSTGLLSSASKNIKTTLKLNDTQFGTFGLVNGYGRMIGTTIYMIVINFIDRKWMYAGSCILKSIFLAGFKFTNNYFILLICRSGQAVLHMPVSIYIPIWVDQFGVFSLKTVMLSINTAVMPAGKVVGYLLHSIFGDANWQNGFLTEAIYLTFVGVSLSLMPGHYFSKNLFLMKDETGGEKVVTKEKESKPRISYFAEKETSVVKKSGLLSIFSDLQTIGGNIQLLSIIIVRVILFGINTALHFWMSDYMRNALGIQDQKLITGSYTLVCLLGPVGGILANSLIQCTIGGYNHPHSPIILICVQCVAAIASISVPFIKTMVPFIIALGTYFTCNSSVLPFVQGLIIDSASPEIKGVAFSVANLLTMIFTSSLFPPLYGLISDKYGHIWKSLAMLVIMSFSAIVLLPLILFAILRYRKMAKEGLLEKGEKPRTSKGSDVARDNVAGDADVVNDQVKKNRKGLKGKGKEMQDKA